MRRLILAASLLLAMNACDDDSRGSGADDNNDNSGPTEPNEPPTAPGSFTAFVIDMVTEHTVDNAAPTEYRTFEMLPDPDGDSNNVDAYRSLF